MVRDFQVNGEALVLTKFGAHIPASMSNIPGAVSNRSELGLTANGVRITPRFNHRDLNVDDYGPETPADVLWCCADIHIGMTLINYDRSILDFCVSESMGGSVPGLGPGTFAFAGQLQPAGTPQGAARPYLMSGYHYVSLSILAPQSADYPGGAGVLFPWHFRAAYLTGPPVMIPLSTQTSLVELNWRAIPYDIPEDADFSSFGEISSSGRILFDHSPDVL